MKTTAHKLIAIVTMSAVGLAASVASACPKGGYGGGYSSYSSYSPTYVKKVYIEPVYSCFRPFHSCVFVLPGDTWATICQREFGSTRFCPQIASFNGIALNTQLVIGQQIRLPEIHPNGALLPSNAPGVSPLALAGQPGLPQGVGFVGSPNLMQGAPQGALLQQGMGLPQTGSLPQNFNAMQTGGAPIANGMQSSGMPVNGLPMGGQPSNGFPQNGGFPQSGGIPSNGLPQNGMPGNGMPMNGGSPVASQNFVGAPMQNSGAPMMNASFNGSAPVGSMLMNGPPSFGNASSPLPNAASLPVSAPSSNIRLVSAEPTVPSVTIGSEIFIDGQLGTESGLVRLRLSGVALKVEVLEWTAATVKIRVPELDLTGAMRAELEVVRADGSVASKSAIELKPSATKLAGNL